MIDEDRTLQLYGYTSDELSEGSHKPIVVVCEMCKNERVTTKRNVNSRGLLTTLCASCGQKNGKHDGKNSPTYKKTIDIFIKKHTGKHFCKCGCGEHIIILRRHYNVGIPLFIKGHDTRGVNNPLFGKHQSNESRIKNSCSNMNIPLSEWSGFRISNRYWACKPDQCIRLNEPFVGCEGHHISRSLLIYIPKELHNHIRHNLKTGKGMSSINGVAIQYLYSD